MRQPRNTFASVLRWVAPPPEIEEPPEELQSKIEWFRCLPFIIIHIAALGVFLVPFTWFCLALALTSYLVRMFAITAFYHRYFSHRAFETSRTIQFIGAFVACSAGQRGPLWWAAHHRRHHRHSDTDKDLHSPHSKSFLFSHMFWFMTEYALPTYTKEIPDLRKFPELVFLNRFDWIPVVALAIFSYLMGESPWAAAHFSATGWQWFFWGFLIPTVALYHGTFCVNSLTHLFGKRRFETKDHSRNNSLVSLLTLGEGWHNNHHFFPGSARQGFRKREFDPTFYMLKALSWIGLVRDLRPVPEWVHLQAKS